MARKIKTLEEAPVDVVEAVKRGFIHRGFIPRKYRRNSQLNDEPVNNDQTDEKSEKSKQSTQNESPKSKKGQKKSDVQMIDSEEGSQEAAKDPKEPEPGEIHEKLIDLTEKAHDVLFQADTVFPFTPFPHTITLDREKLTVASRSFFRVAKIITVPVSSMISAEADVGPFFGTVKMTSKYFVNNTHSVNYLWRHDATEVHRLLQGFIIAQEKKLDVSEIDKDDLRVLLNDLGQGVSD